MVTVTVPSELGLGNGNTVELRRVMPSQDMVEALAHNIIHGICEAREIEQLIKIDNETVEYLVKQAIIEANLPKDIKVTFVPVNLEGFDKNQLPGHGIFISNLKLALFTNATSFVTGDIHPIFTSDGKQTHIEYSTAGDGKPNYCTSANFFASSSIILSGGESEGKLREAGTKLYNTLKEIFEGYYKEYIVPVQQADLKIKRRLEKSVQLARLAEANTPANIIDAIPRLPSILGRKFIEEKRGEVVSVLLDAKLLQKPNINHGWETGAVIVMDRLSGELYRVLPMYSRNDKGDLIFNHMYRTVSINDPKDEGNIIVEPWNEKGLYVLANALTAIGIHTATEKLEEMGLSPESLLKALEDLRKEYMDSTVSGVQKILSSALESKRAQLKNN